MSEINKPRDADQYGDQISAMSDNSIESETRGGFHASFGRGNPCTLLRKKDAGSALSELSGMHALDADPISPVTSRERRPTATGSVGWRNIFSELTPRDFSLLLTQPWTPEFSDRRTIPQFGFSSRTKKRRINRSTSTIYLERRFTGGDRPPDRSSPLPRALPTRRPFASVRNTFPTGHRTT